MADNSHVKDHGANPGFAGGEGDRTLWLFECSSVFPVLEGGSQKLSSLIAFDLK